MKQSLKLLLATTLATRLVCNAFPQEAHKITVVVIDNSTEKKLGPFGGAYRSYHSKLVEALNNAGVRGIAFDMSFTENPAQTEATEAFAGTIAGSKAPVVIGIWGTEQPDGNVIHEPNAAVFNRQQIGQGCIDSRLEMLFPSDWKTIQQSFERGSEIELRTGDYVLPVDPAGCFWLGAEIAVRTGLLKKEQLTATDSGILELVTVRIFEKPGKQLGREQIPAVRVKLRDPKSVPTLSYLDVLTGQADTTALKDAIVLVGIANGRDDMGPNANPKLPSIPGVYYHTFALQDALNRADSMRVAGKFPKLAPVVISQDPLPSVISVLRNWNLPAPK